MAGKQEFVRLNREQKRVLELIKPFDRSTELYESLYRVGFGGLPEGRVFSVIDELEDLNYLTVLRSDGCALGVALHSAAFCYRSEYIANVVMPVAMSMASGASGGLVVWLLAKLFG